MKTRLESQETSGPAADRSFTKPYPQRFRLSALSVALLTLALWLAAPVLAERVMNFTGTGAVTLPNLSAFRLGASNDFAVELWIKPANTGSERGAIFTGDNWSALTSSGTNGGWALYWESGGLRVAYHASLSPLSTVPMGGTLGDLVSITPGVWHHVAVNCKKTERITLYVDGVKKYSSTDAFDSWAYSQRTFDSYQSYRIGADPSGANNFKGSIDEVRVWGRVRTDAEIMNAWQQRPALNGSEPGLLAYYQFNEPSANADSLGAVGSLGTATVSGGPARVDDADLRLAAPLPPATDYVLDFNGSNQSVQTQVTGDKLAGNELSIEYWFKGTKLQSAVRLQAGNRWVVSGWSSPPQNIINTTGSNNLAIAITTTVPGVEDGLWHHVALTWKRNTQGGFRAYLDGSGGGGVDTSDDPFPLLDARVFIGSYGGTSEFLRGQLDEVRIWNRALSADEIKDHAITHRRLFNSEPGLVAYFGFNDASATGTVDAVSDQPATFLNISAADRVVQDGVLFGDPVFRTVPNPAGAGLWLGEVSLNSVNEVTSHPTNTTPAGGTFDFNIILHAGANGVVRLLKDVTVMQKRNTASNVTDIVLLTDDALIPNYDGVLKRAGKLVGVRYSSAFYQFAGQSLPMAGGIGYAFRVAGTNSIPAGLPTNPFRHLYHPQHRNPVDLQGVPYDLTRIIEINLTGGGLTGQSEGRDRLEGTYRETLWGLHKIPLIVEGSIRLQRVSLVNKLNDQ